MKHLFTPDDADEGGSSFVSELEADVTAECKKLGTVEKVRSCRVGRVGGHQRGRM